MQTLQKTTKSIEVTKMAFSEETKRIVFERQGGRCGNPDCGKQLVWGNRGCNGGRGAWEAHHKVPVSRGGSDSPSNCIILCYDCHQRPQASYGKKKSGFPDLIY